MSDAWRHAWRPRHAVLGQMKTHERCEALEAGGDSRLGFPDAAALYERGPPAEHRYLPRWYRDERLLFPLFERGTV